MKRLVSLLSLVLLLSVAVPAAADTTLYNNGAPIGNSGASVTAVIGAAPFETTDSFTLSSPADVESMSLGILVPTVDIPATLQFGISASPFGTNLGNGTGTLSTNVFLFTTTSGNSSPLDLYSSSFIFPSIDLAAGTYWITLFNGIDNMGFVLAWDVNNGPSKAFFQNTNRPIDSESFSLDGIAVVPEPGTWILVGTGIFAIAGTIRRKPTVTG